MLTIWANYPQASLGEDCRAAARNDELFVLRLTYFGGGIQSFVYYFWIPDQVRNDKLMVARWHLQKSYLDRLCLARLLADSTELYKCWAANLIVFE